MIESVRRRWFPSAEEQLAEAHEEERKLSEERAVVQEFLTLRYTSRFRQWLDSEILSADVKPGDHASMLSQAGYLAGLRHVQARFEQLRRSVENK